MLLFLRAHRARRFCSPKGLLLSLHRAGGESKGHSLSRKKMAPLEPQEKGLDWQPRARMTFVPPEWKCLRSGSACVAVLLRSPPMVLQDDLPLLLSSAVAQPLAALLPYGCGTPLAGAALPVSWQCSLIPVYRQSPQCGERSNAAISQAVCRHATVTHASR